MRKNFVCIFAHPDDEVFGPGGSIAMFAKTYNVYILCATRGEAGKKNGEQDLGKIRETELLRSARILGVKKVFFLDFKDGTLSNNLYHKLAEKIKAKLEELRPEIILTFEPLGISGHIDHITVSLVTAYVFELLPFVKKLLRYCQTKKNIKIMKKIRKEYFIYRPDGYDLKDIGLVNDVSTTWKTKVRAMLEHKSQIHDIRWILSFYEKLPRKEYFLVMKK